MSALCQKRTHALQQNGFYSITSSARSRNDSEILSPIALAALRFTTNSNLVDRITGRSATFPCHQLLRILGSAFQSLANTRIGLSNSKLLPTSKPIFFNCAIGGVARESSSLACGC